MHHNYVIRRRYCFNQTIKFINRYYYAGRKSNQVS